MTKRKKPTVLFLLLILPVLQVQAQTGSAPAATDNTFEFPQFAKDIRRFEIVAFGVFPFAVLFSSLGFGLYRWHDKGGFDMEGEGRRYAPWPLKPSNAEPWTGDEERSAVLLAAGVSLAVAVADQIIVQIKRHKARKKAEIIPTGSVIINRVPLPEEMPDDAGAADDEPAEDRMEGTDANVPDSLLPLRR